MRRIWPLIPLIALAALVGLGGFILLRGAPRETFSAGLVGRPAPSFALMRLDGQGVITSDAFAGRPHLINLFASWCTPCRAEHPLLMNLDAQGVAILGVAYKDRPDATQGFLQELGDPFEVVVQDPGGRFGLELGAAGVPETFAVSADGRVVAVHRGPLTQEALNRDLLPALRN